MEFYVYTTLLFSKIPLSLISYRVLGRDKKRTSISLDSPAGSASMPAPSTLAPVTFRDGDDLGDFLADDGY